MFQGVVAEFFGLSNRVLLARKVTSLVRLAKDQAEDAGLQVLPISSI